jgi:hypothetical protein
VDGAHNPKPVNRQDRMYSLYGLRIKSAIDLPCPEWRGPDDSADVYLREVAEEEITKACKAPPTHIESDGFWEYRRFDDGAARFSWKDHFDFLISGDGAQVLWRRLVGVPDEVLFTYLLNQVLSHCLLLRGVESLHATSVVIGGNAIAILGDTGYGKSTLAAAFMRMGYPLLTDDVLVPEFVGKRVLVHASLPRLKLLPESADAVLRSRPSLPMNTFTDKMILSLEAAEHVTHPVPLRALFAIPSQSGSATISIQRAKGHAALLPLVKNTFEPTLFSRHRLEQQFRFANRLAKCVPVKLLSYPRRMELLPAVVAAILTDLAQDRGSR